MLKNPYKRFFGTLANNQRLEIINLLLKGPFNVTRICGNLNFNQTTVSHHLSKLESCKFVSVKRNGKERIYSLNKETIMPLMKLMNNHVSKFCDKCGDTDGK